MKRNFLILFFFLASLRLSPFALNLSATEVARVGDAVITTETLNQTVARQGYNLYEADSIRKGLDDSIRFELLAASAAKLGVDKDPTLARQIKELMVQRLVAQKIDGALITYHAAPEAVQGYFAAHTNEFRRPALARGTIITILIESGKEAEARSKAAMALQELKSTLKPDAVVRAYSDDPGEKVAGGVSNFFIEGEPSRRYPQAVSDAILNLKLRGDVAGPIESPRALYLIKLIERRDAQPLPYEQVKAEIYKRLQREQREKLLTEYCESLKKEIPVTVDEAQLKAAYPKPANQGGPPPRPSDTP